MNPVAERDEHEVVEFKLLDLGEVSEQTKGMDAGLRLEGGDPPYNRIICYPC